MGLFTELECGICYLPYTRCSRQPQVLKCCHTFCSKCVERLVLRKRKSATLTCPVCRMQTVYPRTINLSESLPLDSDIWRQIPAEKPQEEQPEETLHKLLRTALTHVAGRSSRRGRSAWVRPKLKWPQFLKNWKSRGLFGRKQNPEEKRQLESDQKLIAQVPWFSVL
ncbi:E3 ubiquitin-protein ligase RNF182 [Callorhinchus milii]|uniref:E3 ubiquitin-protein ligase RNF182-like n=1 Tax=Callorhinchus milii TaxID=7868 RepID=V9KTH1_CALMI|nr:E3 ubiquitin-protein ligase RNF182 [Callorhinchus milii]|eukprot:gi/632934296/ref/XP_007906697.1/ PREDICTED: E3 ubiquitin-protein ligase RNF182-like [Callorhinchus milii]